MRAEDLKQLKLWSIFVLIILSLTLVSSQSANPNDELIFGLKRVQEKAFLKTISDPRQRVEYMRTLLENRLKELTSVVVNKKYDFVLKSALRYSTLAGQITELIEANNLKDLTESTKMQFNEHYKKLESLYVFYPKNIPDNVEWKYIQDDYNYLKIYLDKLSKLK